MAPPAGDPCYSEVVIVDDESPPAQVSGVRLEPGRGALTVDWNAVVGATGYKVQWKSGAETFADAATDSREAIISSGSTTRYSIPGLTDGTVYTVRVIATRTGAPGDGAASDEVTGKPGVPTLTIADAKATEGNAVEFTVTLDPVSASDVTVAYATTDGTATADSSDADGADYTAPESGAQLTISANQTSGTISIATGDDTVDEDDETFTVTLSDPSSDAELGVQKTATGTIEDDDTDPAVITNIGFTNVPSSGQYGLGDVIEVSVTFDAAVDVTGSPHIALQLLDVPAADRYAVYVDSASSDTTLVFRKTVTAAVDDMVGMVVGANALDLNGGGIVNKDTTVAAVLDHDALSGGNIRTRIISGMKITSVPEVVAPAGYYGPGEEVEFTVIFEGPVTVETGSGTPALKFIASDSARQEAAYASGSGGTALVFTWTVPADVSGDEVPIEIPSNVGAGGALLTNGGLVLAGGTIRDSSARDVNIRHGQSTTVSAVDTTGPALVVGAEGATVSGTELVLTFERAAGEAEHLDEDSVPAAGDFAVRVPSMVHTVSDVAVSDVAVAGATVTLTLSDPVGHAQTVTVDYTPGGTGALEDVWGNNAPGFSARSVRNDSPEPELSIGDVTVDEGDGTAQFTVTLDLASGETVTVDYATANGTALAGSDYTAASGTLTFAAGDTSKTIDVLVTDDSLGEGDEDFTVTLSSASNAGMSDGEATGTITDNEIPTLTIADATATEGASVSFTVTLDPESSSDVTVAYATSDGTATADSADPDGADYTAPASGAELTISAGRTSETISIATGDDTVDEDDETFTLTLSNPSSNAELGVQKTATGTIEDDDTDPAQVTNVAFTNEPPDGVYGLGDVIEVSVTFDAAVDVTGTPRIALQLLGTPAADRYAFYDDSASSDTELVFRKTVTAAVDDMDGMGVGASALERNDGGIVNKDTTVAAVLDHDALSGGNIRTRIISGIEITSDPKVVAPAGYYGPGEKVEFTVTFAGLVTVDTSSGTPALLFIASDGARQEIAYASGPGFAELVFTWTVPADVPGDEVPIEIPSNVGTGGALLTDRGLVLSGGTIRDSSGRDVNIRHGPYATDSAADTTGPALVAGAEGATVAGTELVLTFERAAGEAEHLNEDSVPAAGDFAVRVPSMVHTVSDVAVAGATVTLTLSDPVGHAQTVTVDYTPGGTGALEDVWGNNAPGFSARSVRNDSPEPELSIGDVTVDEGDGTAQFTVTLDLASGETVTVDYATANGTALAGSDYTAASGTLTFAAGDTSKTIDVLVTDDSLGEGDEDFTVTLSSASNAGMSDGEATGTITDNEIPTLTIADATATEGASVSFTVTLDPASSSSDVTVAYATSDGTATADSADADGADYTAPASGAELIIGAGHTSGTITIATGDDTVYEEDETFTVTLSSASSNAALGTSKTATGTIENDDSPSADAALKALTMTAGGSGVTLSPTFVAEIYSYRADVANTVSSVSVAAEANHRKAMVAIIGGADLAFAENIVTVRVTAEDGATTQDYTVIVTRALPELAWEGQSTLSVDEDTGAVELTVTLTPASSDQVTVDYVTMAAGGAMAGEDYTHASGTLTFAPGETRKTTTVTILDDTLYEPGSVDGVLVMLSGLTGTAVLGAATIYLQIQDNESPPTATMEDVTVDEGAGTMVFTLSLAHGISRGIEYRTGSGGLGGTATEGVDYDPFVSETGVVNLRIPARQTSATFAVTILDDDVHEADETISIRWSANSPDVATESIDVTGTITNDDERGVEVSATTLTVREGGDGTYTVVLTSQPTGPVTVTPSVTGSADVTVSPSPLTFTAGNWDTAQTVTVSAASDADAENDTATIGHTIAGADYGANSVTADDVTVTVTDDGTASTQVTLTVDPTAVGEGASATTVTVTGTLDNAVRTEDTAVTVTVSAGTASTSDFAPVSAFTLTIDANQPFGTAMFTLTPTDDDVDEVDETVTVEGGAAAAGLNVTATTVTINDDDERGVQVSPTTLTVPEGGDGTYTVVLTSEPTGPVTVMPSVTGSADVTVSPPPLTFTAGNWDTAQTVTVSAGSDADAENDTATIGHTIAGADYGVNGVTADDVTVMVTDDGTASTQVTLAVDPTAVGEGDGATTVTVIGTLDHAVRTEDTEVTVTVSAGTASTSDFAPVSAFTLTIDEGQAFGTAMFTLTPTDDDVDEVDETVTVEGGAAAAGLNVTATTVTINDDDERGVQVSPTTLTVREGADGTYTVVLTSEPTGPVTVMPSHGAGDTDVTVSLSPLTFTATNWDEAQTVTVSAGLDADAENDTATIGHTIAGADYGANGVTADDVTVMVTDDGTASTQVTLAVDPTAVGEGDGATTVTVTGTLDHAVRTEDTEVTVTVSAGTASTSDFAPVSAFTLTIDANQPFGTAMFTLTPTDDDVDEVDETVTVEGGAAAAGLNVTATTVTITDDDERGVQVSPTTLTVREGADGTYTVVLTSEPTGPVTVTPSVTGSPDVTVSPSPLTFTAGNWDTTQTVTVSAGSDADAENDTATIGHTIVGVGLRRQQRDGGRCDGDGDGRRYGVDAGDADSESHGGRGGRERDDGDGDRDAGQCGADGGYGGDGDGVVRDGIGE